MPVDQEKLQALKARSSNVIRVGGKRIAKTKTVVKQSV